jgi:hypothetical protein
MKKLLLALALMLLPATAHATVSCSVPFNLTNGTTADATQVMANYNAILACLSTGAASSGSNSDITSLNALSTPITPAQGGAQALCGATGFVAQNDAGLPNTEIDIVFSQAILNNNLKAVQNGTNGSLVLNFSTTGVVNGLDAGSLTASTTYYLYLIGNGTLINSLASLSSTTPTLPAGYTFKCRVGSTRADASVHLYPIYQAGRQHTLTTLEAGLTDYFVTSGGAVGNCNTNTFVAQSFAGIPATAVAAQGRVSMTAPATMGVGHAINAPAVEWKSTGTDFLILAYSVPLPTASSVFFCAGGAGVALGVNGWVDSVNAN